MKKYIIANFFFLIIVILKLSGCASINYKKLSIENPAALIAIEDSLLLVNKNNQSVNEAIVVANNKVATNYLNNDELSFAVEHFKKAISIDPDNKDSQFGLIIAEGRILINRGNKNGIWDAIESFSKASLIYPNKGDPFYWIAISYTKLGDTEFDLILESYEKSLSLELDENIKADAEKNYEKAKSRKNKLDSFWK